MRKIEQWPTDRLIEYARNPRKNDHAVERVASMLKEFGWRAPIIATSDGVVVDGHLRLKAARKLGMKEVPVILADDLTPTQIKALRIAMNKSAELADWDDDLLRLEFDDLAEMGFDLDLTGFSAEEIGSLGGLSSDDIPPDDFAEVDENIDTEHECPKCGYAWSGKSGKAEA